MDQKQRDKILNLIKQIGDVADESVLQKANEFVDELRFSKSVNTILSYLYDIKIGLSFFNKTAPHKKVSIELLLGLNIPKFRSLCANRLSQNISPTSQQRFIITWKVWLRFIGSDAITHFKLPKKPIRHPNPMSEQDIQKIYTLPESSTWLDYRNRALWSLMYGSGLRISEALSLKTSELSEVIRIVGKGNKHRIVPILPQVLQYIEEYLAIRPFQGDFIFLGTHGAPLTQQTAGHIFREWRIKNNLPSNLTLHSLRHSFATHLLRNQCPLKAVQKLLGHSNLSVTMQYTSISSEQLANSYKKFMEE